MSNKREPLRAERELLRSLHNQHRAGGMSGQKHKAEREFLANRTP